MVTADTTFTSSNLDDLGQNMKEDVSKIITNISPEDTPCLSMFRDDKAHNTKKEWLQHSLQAAGANAHLDGEAFGANVTNDNTNAPARLGNYIQIPMKQWSIGDQAEAVSKYGRDRDYALQMAWKGAEIKRDIELAINANTAAAAAGGSGATSAGIPVWIRTNDDLGVGGASGALNNTTYGEPTTARTDGTLRALSEATFLATIANAWIAGGKPDCVPLYPTLKQRVSGYLFGGGGANPRSATQNQDHGSKINSGVTAVGAVDVYVSDFGKIALIPNRFMRSRDVPILTKNLWKVAWIRKYRHKRLAPRGASEEGMLIADFTLMALAENGNGMVADVDSTTAMVA